MTFIDEHGTWVALEEITPQLVSRLPEVVQLKQALSGADKDILGLAQRTFPLPQPPQRSDDFVTDRNLFDDITATYVRLLRDRFAYWYQDLYLRQYLPTIPDSTDRLWAEARHYHLYGRLAQAESRYRQLLAQPSPTKYRERLPLFLSRLLIRQKRFSEARDMLEAFLDTAPETRWAHFQLALCYEKLHDPVRAISHFERYQQLHGRKMSLEAVAHLAKLRPST